MKRNKIISTDAPCARPIFQIINPTANYSEFSNGPGIYRAIALAIVVQCLSKFSAGFKIPWATVYRQQIRVVDATREGN